MLSRPMHQFRTLASPLRAVLFQLGVFYLSCRQGNDTLHQGQAAVRLSLGLHIAPAAPYTSVGACGLVSYIATPFASCPENSVSAGCFWKSRRPLLNVTTTGCGDFWAGYDLECGLQSLWLSYMGLTSVLHAYLRHTFWSGDAKTCYGTKPSARRASTNSGRM
ncbi:hypothetical protein C8Q73DRAFT_292840 [Cubamyces lactineus]|nr:hypothetical protein C8Q73DRAFT_292840 [Cubamyces lactineus]